MFDWGIWFPSPNLGVSALNCLILALYCFFRLFGLDWTGFGLFGRSCLREEGAV